MLIHLERAGAGVNPIRLSWVSSSNSGNCMVGLRPAHKSGLNFRTCPRARLMTWLLERAKPDPITDPDSEWSDDEFRCQPIRLTPLTRRKQTAIAQRISTAVKL